MFHHKEIHQTDLHAWRHKQIMSDTRFTFPPPPPPPPPAASQFQSGYSQPARGNRGYNGQRTRGGRDSHGNARGEGRGGSAYGHFSSSHSPNRYGGNNDGHSSSESSSHTSREPANANGRYPLPNYPSIQQPQYPSNLRQEYGQQLPNYAPTFSGLHRPTNEYSMNWQNPPAGSHLNPKFLNQFQNQGGPLAQSTIPTYQSAKFEQYGFTGQPQPMGPPIRMGFSDNQYGQQASPDQYTNNVSPPSLNGGSTIPQISTSPYQPGIPDFTNHFSNHRKRGLKRGRSEASSRSQTQNPEPQAAPAVPAFGGPLPLPSKPPSIVEPSQKPRRKRRKHNQLGLTPKTEEHESSEEEEDDADEESKLAANASGSSNGAPM